MRLLLCGVAALLAGCAAAAPAHPAVDYQTTDHATNFHPPRPGCLTFAGQAPLVAVGAEAGPVPYTAASLFAASARLEVPADATAVILDIWWDGGATTGLRSVVRLPDGQTLASPAQPTADEQAPLRLRFDDPQPGGWEWEATAEHAAVGVRVHFREGLYYDEPEPLRYECNAGIEGRSPASAIAGPGLRG